MILPGTGLAGPGCMHNQRMAQGFYPYSPMGPQMAYGQRAPRSYQPSPAPYAGMMAGPYHRPLPVEQGRAEITGNPAPAAARAGDSTQATANSQVTQADDSVTVRINGMRFQPANITVKPGTTVTWIQESRMPHTVSGQSGGLRSSTLYNGHKFSHTFDAAGQYDYYCELHPSMKGTVVVEDEAGDG
jgi:plastocyanin